VLLGFYCGVRLKEVSTLLLKDIYLYGNSLHLDINSKGIKKTGFKLKTISSKRRIDVAIENPQHLKIITEFLEMRSKLDKKSNFLFLELSEYNGFLNKSINVSSFEYINEIIQSVTKRYCTYHSLRHSFATYQCQRFFPKGSSYPYELLELSDKIGHRTPDTTVQSYVHGWVLFLAVNK
jgi:integrase